MDKNEHIIDKIKRNEKNKILVDDDIVFVFNVNIDNERHNDIKNDVKNINILENKFGNKRVRKKSIV